MGELNKHNSKERYELVSVLSASRTMGEREDVL